MDSTVHAARGALVAGGGLTLLQSTLARRLQRPSGLALSVGGFVGTIRLLESLGNKRFGRGYVTKEHVPSAAASVAALVAMYFLEAKKKGLLISYVTMEALLVLVNKHTTLAEIKHIDFSMALLACHRIIYIWLYEPFLLSKSQLVTLDTLTRVPANVLIKVRAELPVNAEISRCAIFHPDQTCADFHAGFLSTHIQAAMKLYIPIYFFSAVVTKYAKWIWGPRPDLQRLILQYLRTCACLSMSFVVPLGFSCVSPIKSHRVTVSIAGMLIAATLWIEHEKRRVTLLKSLALYPIVASGAQLSRLLQLSPRAVSLYQYVLFSASLAVLFQRPKTQHPMLMQLLFGRKPASANANSSASVCAEANQEQQ